MKILFILFLLTVTVTCSCKKSTDKTVSGTAISYLIKTVDYYYGKNFTANYKIVYNAQNKVDSIVVFSTNRISRRSFAYSDSGYVITNHEEPDNGIFYLTKVITDKNGQITKTTDYVLQDSSVTLYAYNGTELTSAQYFAAHSTPSYMTFSWTNGDVDGYRYSKDKWQQGGIPDIVRFLSLGTSLIKTDHLAIGAVLATNTKVVIAQYIYLFDKEGRISLVMLPSGKDTAYYRYTY